MDTPTPRSGAPTKFTEETKKTIIAALQRGATYEMAAHCANVSYDSFNNWIKQGKAEDDGEYFEFFKEVRRARAQRGVRCLDIIGKAADEGSWQAATWLLERLYRKKYGKQLHEHSTKPGKPLEHAHDIIASVTIDSIDDRVKRMLGETE